MRIDEGYPGRGRGGFRRVACDDEGCVGATFELERTPDDEVQLVCRECGARHALSDAAALLARPPPRIEYDVTLSCGHVVDYTEREYEAAVRLAMLEPRGPHTKRWACPRCAIGHRSVLRMARRVR